MGDHPLGERTALYTDGTEPALYRQWALDVSLDDAMLECSSAAGIVSSVNAAMGVALLSDRHIRGEMKIKTERLPPALAYVVRRARKSRNAALDSLVAEIKRDTTRHGGLALAS